MSAFDPKRPYAGPGGNFDFPQVTTRLIGCGTKILNGAFAKCLEIGD